MIYHSNARMINNKECLVNETLFFLLTCVEMLKLTNCILNFIKNYFYYLFFLYNLEEKST